jgi:hypothetical protein
MTAYFIAIAAFQRKAVSRPVVSAPRKESSNHPTYQATRATLRTPLQSRFLSINTPVSGRNCVLLGIPVTSQPLYTAMPPCRSVVELSGQYAPALLRGSQRKAVTPFPVTPFCAEIEVLSKQAGGRDTSCCNGLRPQFYFRTTDDIASPLGLEGTTVLGSQGLAGAMAAAEYCKVVN